MVKHTLARVYVLKKHCFSESKILHSSLESQSESKISYITLVDDTSGCAYLLSEEYIWLSVILLLDVGASDMSHICTTAVV